MIGFGEAVGHAADPIRERAPLAPAKGGKAAVALAFRNGIRRNTLVKIPKKGVIPVKVREWPIVA
jgi:hypothetical protein